jgi:phage recombination protein Bet
MSTEISVSKNREIKTLSKSDIELIKSQIAVGATDGELELFISHCQRTGLDPLSRQIYCIKRGGKATIQVSIDGFRVIAERSGEYAGQSEPVFQYDGNGDLVCAKVTVFKWKVNTRYECATGVAFLKEYKQESGGLWNKMPHVMLAKVAEALALRKAFPQDLSGLYSPDEMSQAESEQTMHDAVILTNTLQDWITVFAACKTEKELGKVYKDNSAEIDANPEIFNALKERTNQIRHAK